MEIVKVSASRHKSNIVLLKKLQEHTGLSIPKIVVGKTLKGSYFYKETHPKPFEYAYTVLIKSDGTKIVTQIYNENFTMTKIKDGKVYEDLRAQIGDENGSKNFISKWTGNLIGKKKEIPENIMKILNDINKEVSPIS